MTLGRSGRRFLGDRRRVDPPPKAKAPGDPPERSVGVLVASAAAHHYVDDAAYRLPNLREFHDQTDDFAGRVADVLALPEPTAVLEERLSRLGGGLPAQRAGEEPVRRTGSDATP